MQKEIEKCLFCFIKNKKTDVSFVAINQGYGAKNTEYSFIANALAARGYFVVSIGHDLETDAPLARTSNLFEKRKPLWAPGVKNILFVYDYLRKVLAEIPAAQTEAELEGLLPCKIRL